MPYLNIQEIKPLELTAKEHAIKMIRDNAELILECAHLIKSTKSGCTVISFDIGEKDLSTYFMKEPVILKTYA